VTFITNVQFLIHGSPVPNLLPPASSEGVQGGTEARAATSVTPIQVESCLPKPTSFS